MIKRDFVSLCVVREDINKSLYLQNDWRATLYWENVIMGKVKQGKLCNNKEELIRWMAGVADGWIEYKKGD